MTCLKTKIRLQHKNLISTILNCFSFISHIHTNTLGTLGCKLLKCNWCNDWKYTSNLSAGHLTASPPQTAPSPPARLPLPYPSLFPLCPFTNTHTVDYLAIERGRWGDKVSMLRGGNMWDGEEIRRDTNREGQRACRKQRLISQLTHVWTVCLMINLQLQQKAKEPIITNLTTFLTISVHFICSLSERTYCLYRAKVDTFSSY